MTTPKEPISDRVLGRNSAARIRALDAALAQGIADAEAGRAVPVEEAFARIRARLSMAGAGASETASG